MSSHPASTTPAPPRHLRVFVSSPGDVAEERKIAHDILTKLPFEPSLHGQVTLDPVFWDRYGAPITANLTPQEAIIQGLPLPSECDIVVVILWSRMGTPLPAKYRKESGEPYLSGTEWEYEDAIRAGDKPGGPTVLLYRRTDKVLIDPGDPDLTSKVEQLRFVNRFFDSLQDAAGTIKRGHSRYQNTTEFGEKLSYDLKFLVERLLNPRAVAPPIAPVIEPEFRLPKHNLPRRRFAELFGRKADLDGVMQKLESRYPIILIDGFAGVGKTSLAIEAGYLSLQAHEKAASHAQPIGFEYVVWIAAHNNPEQQHWLEDVLNTIGKVTNFAKVTLMRPEQKTEKQQLVHALLARYRILLILDNCESINDQELFDWLTEVPEPSKVLATSQVPQFQQAWQISLKGLGDEEAIKFIRTEAERRHLQSVADVTDEDLRTLVRVTAGNPAAIELAVGAMKGGTLCLAEVVNSLSAHDPKRGLQPVFDVLFAGSWMRLSEPARQTLRVIPVFTGANSISIEALRKVAGLSMAEFNNAIEQLVDFSLVEVDYARQRYSVLPMTRAFARGQLEADPERAAEARTRWSQYFLEYAEQAKRTKPAEVYWNALVTDAMKAIDDEWPSIYEVLKWADEPGREKLLLELVLLLVHYMDSRFLNTERLHFVQRAVEVARRQGLKQVEALLRIDALGWTYVEEHRLDDALREISAGQDLVDQMSAADDDRPQLRALGLAWQARALIERNQIDEAEDLIRRALDISCRAVIRYRVLLSAGDIELKQGRSQAALRLYHAAVAVSEEYGGDGKGYQTDPRIGLAALENGDVEEAKSRFTMLLKQNDISIGKLYGDYGLALVSYKQGDREGARRLAKSAKEELDRRSRSNLLCNLIDRLFRDLEAERTAVPGARADTRVQARPAAGASARSEIGDNGCGAPPDFPAVETGTLKQV